MNEGESFHGYEVGVGFVNMQPPEVKPPVAQNIAGASHVPPPQAPPAKHPSLKETP